MSSKHSRKRSLSYSDITPDQQAVIDLLFEQDHTLMVAKKGFGKTVVAQTAAQEMIDAGHLSRVLMIAPPRVVRNTWAREWAAWEHLRRPWVVGLDGPRGGDRRWEVMGNKELVVLSHELLEPMFAFWGREHGFDGLIIDELTRFKAAGSRGTRLLRKHHRDFKWVVGMTATPFAEAGTEIYAQALVVDGGRTLGKRQDQFLMKYFRPLDYKGYRWDFLPGGEAALTRDLRGLAVLAADDSYFASLPEITEEVLEVQLGATERDAYEQMSREMLLGEITADSAAVLVGKLQQIASGFLYREDGGVDWIGGSKLDAVAELVREEIAGGENVLLAHWYTAELEGLQERLGAYPLITDPGMVDRWNSGEVRLVGIHPASGGHGLNLQGGGRRLICCGPIWSADKADQLKGRLWRRGQEREVIVTTAVAAGTIDELVLDRVDGKALNEQRLMDHLKKSGPALAGPERMRA